MAGVSVKFKAIDEISSKFDAMVTAGERALDAFDKMESSADKAYSTVSDGAGQASDAMDRATKSTDYWTDAIGNYDKGAMEAIYTTEELVEMGFKTEDALSEVADTAEKATEELDKFGKESEDAADKSGEFGDKSQDAITGLEEVLTAAGIVMALHEIGAAFVECSDAAAEFETSMAVVSTIADSTVLSSEQISAQIKQVSKDTAIAVTDLAEATYGAISASVATADAVAFVEQANQLAVGGFTSQATAVDVLTTAINAYGLSADKAGQLSDYLVTTQNLGKTTVDQLASSIGMVIPSAAAFNVQMDNLSTAYAILTANGVQTAQSTTYLKAMFTELASAESEVAQVLQEETGQSFAELMEQGYSLGDVMQILGDSVDGNTTAFMNMWGSMEAGSGAVSLYNSGAEKYAQVLGQMQQSAGATAKAYETMTNTTEFSSQRMANSFNNLKIAIGDDLNPVVSDFQNGIADVVDGFTDFIEQNPAISALLTGVTVGIGTVTLGITAYTAVTKIATVASAAFGAAVNSAIWPLTLAAAAIGGITAAVIYFANQEDDMERAMDTLTSSSKEQQEEIAALEAEYQALADAGEADTVAAYQLKNEIEELTEEFENNKTTIRDLIEENERLKTSYEETTTAYEETIDTITQNESEAKSLVAQLAAMQDESELSGEQLEIMKNIVDRLNSSYEGLNLTLDETNGKLNMSIEDLWKAVTREAEAQKAQANMDALMSYLGQYQEAQKLYQEANETMIDEKHKLDDIYDDIVNGRFAEDHPILNWTGWAKGAEMNYYSDYGDQHDVWEAAKEATAGAKANFEALEESIRGCYEQMGYTTEEIDEMMAELAKASAQGTLLAEDMQAATQIEVSSQEAIEEAIGDVESRLTDLATAYDEAYKSAYDSINGQIGLFESMKTESEQSVADMQAALESQAEYLKLYTENLQKAADYGLDESLIASLSDGSAESAGQLDAIIQKIEQLGGTTEDAKEFVDSFNASFAEVESAKETWATSVAKMETDFDDAMAQIESDMEETIDNLNMSDIARESAKYTMDAYVSEIEAGVARAQSALDSISFANTKLDNGDFEKKWTMSDIPGTTAGIATLLEGGYASGTDSAEQGLHLVGENGPEIVDFDGGERVYTAEETNDILSNRRNDEFYVAPADTEESSGGSGDKTITLKLEGAGEMKVGTGGMSKADVVDILIENVKEVLMGIIQQEILEEGDLSYEF